MPIVWGGVHPTLLPEQTAADPRVDVVVRGESEPALAPLAAALAAGGRWTPCRASRSRRPAR